jgi:hypothetical protein
MEHAMTAHFRHYHPNDPAGRELDFYGVATWLDVEEVLVDGYLWLTITQVEIVGTGGEGWRIETVRAGDPWREIDLSTETGKLVAAAIRTKLEDRAPEALAEAAR